MPTVCLTLTLACLLVVQGCRNQRDYMQRGNRFLQEGKLADAVLQYRKAIQKDPKFGEAYYRWGLAELKQGHSLEAFRALTQARKWSPENEDAAVKLADLNLAFYLSDPHRSKTFYDAVARLSSELLEKNPDSVDGLRLKGALALLDRKPQEAIQFYQKANRLRPLQFDVVEGLVQSLFEDNQFAEGERWAIEFLAKEQTAASIYDILLQRYLAAKRFGDGENILVRKVANNPQVASYRVQLARFYANQDKPAQMTSALQPLLDHPNEFPQGHLQVGDYYNSLGKREEALRQFQEGARLNPKERIVYEKRLADTFLAIGNREEATKLVDQILRELPSDLDARMFRASLLLDAGSKENLISALSQFQDLVLENPRDAVLRFNLGRAYWRNGSLPEARVEFIESAKLRADYAAPRLGVAEIGLSLHRMDETLRAAEEVLALDSHQPRARLLHAIALSGLGKHAEAHAELTDILRDFPGSEEARLRLGIIAISQKKFSEAEKIFRGMQQPGQSEPLAAAGLAETFSAQKHFDKAIQVLQAEQNNSPGSFAIGNLLAFTAMRAGNYDVAIQAYTKLLNRAPENATIYLSLGQAYFAKRDFEQAIRVLEQAKKLAPNEGRADMLLAAAFGQTGRSKEMKSRFENVLKLQPDNPTALNNMAYYLAEYGGNLDEALRLAQRAVQKQTEPIFSDTLGWIYIKKNMPDAGLQIFRNLVNKQPDNPTFRYHLGAAFLGKGDRDHARVELARAMELHPAPEEAEKIKQLLAGIQR
jgi:tetratricopeptide (TPR) repeat protein